MFSMIHQFSIELLYHAGLQSCDIFHLPATNVMLNICLKIQVLN